MTAPPRYPTSLRQLIEHVSDDLAKQGYDARIAHEAAFACAEYLRRAYGGATFYVAFGYDAEADERAQTIWAEFTGHNHDALAARYGVSRRWVEIIVSKMRERERLARQPMLSGIEDSPHRRDPPPLRAPTKPKRFGS